ncbi:hypothetical protein [Streptomyces sp. NPDC050988]|uniref:hypothetical protein n=1 Tax=Streptomyces sp. NPDC050988 TaxID=3365637 RepID=UPI0037BCFB9C
MDAIERYRPRLPGPVWERIGPDCRRTVTKAKPTTPKEARDWLGALAHAAAHAYATGRPTRAEHLLTREAIEGYLATGCLHMEESSRPYTQPEQAQLYANARAQPTDELRFGLLTLLALGFGCALDSPEVIPLRTHDVREALNGAVAVGVRGSRTRTVLRRTAWAPVLIEATTRASRPSQARYLFRPESHARGTNTVTNFLARTRIPSAAHPWSWAGPAPTTTRSPKTSSSVSAPWAMSPSTTTPRISSASKPVPAAPSSSKATGTAPPCPNHSRTPPRI